MDRTERMRVFCRAFSESLGPCGWIHPDGVAAMAGVPPYDDPPPVADLYDGAAMAEEFGEPRDEASGDSGTYPYHWRDAIDAGLDAVLAGLKNTEP